MELVSKDKADSNGKGQQGVRTDNKGYQELGQAMPLPQAAGAKPSLLQYATCEIEPPVIDPDAEWKQTFDLIILVLILYSACAVPIAIAFAVESSGWQWYMEVSFSLLFLVDLVLNFNLGYYHDGLMVRTRKRIALRYFQGWFWIDAPSSVPVELIELYLTTVHDSEAPDGLAILRVLRMFRLVRLLRLLKVDQYLSRLEEEFEVNLRLMRLVQLIIKLLFISHLVGCGWMAMATLADEPDQPTWLTSFEIAYEESHMAAGEGSPLVSAARHLRLKSDDVSSDPTGQSGGGMALPLATRYFYSFYWALCTLVGSGSPDVVPVTDSERKYDACVALLSALVFGYVIGEISTLLASLDRQAALVEEKMDAVKEYLAWRQVPRDLSIKVRRYYEYYWTQASAFDENDILENLPPLMHNEVVKFVSAETLQKVPIFKRLDPSSHKYILPLLKPLACAPGDIIYKRGQESANLCFLVKGEVVMLAPTDDISVELRLTPTKLRIYDANHNEVLVLEGEKSVQGCFGHSIMQGRRRRHVCKASEKCEIQTLDKEDIVELFEKDPQNAMRLCLIVQQAYTRVDALQNFSSRQRIANMQGQGTMVGRVLKLCYSLPSHLH
mmetsp:Transcript_18159/g.36614  ORF Transcript_18159/g.36614 Transcript_18159/m.36614 type:complete len:611 (-) Transcript_18159:819-2651(-)